MADLKFPVLPTSMSEQAFVDLFGGVYEHSPWIAIQAYQAGLSAKHNSVDGLAQTLSQIVNNASNAQKLNLILAHPDLAGKAARAGELTPASSSEQTSAGIDQCNSEEFNKFHLLNNAYKQKFKFPFIMAVKNSNRKAILDAFEARLLNDYETEFERAIGEIHKIASFRLEVIAND